MRDDLNLRSSRTRDRISRDIGVSWISSRNLFRSQLFTNNLTLVVRSERLPDLSIWIFLSRLIVKISTFPVRTDFSTSFFPKENPRSSVVLSFKNFFLSRLVQSYQWLAWTHDPFHDSRYLSMIFFLVYEKEEISTREKFYSGVSRRVIIGTLSPCVCRSIYTRTVMHKFLDRSVSCEVSFGSDSLYLCHCAIPRHTRSDRIRLLRGPPLKSVTVGVSDGRGHMTKRVP